MWLLVLATAMLVLGVFSLLKSKWGSWAKPFTTWLFGYPVGPIVFITLGIVFGGISGVMMGGLYIWDEAKGQTASLSSDDVSSGFAGEISCSFASAPTEVDTTTNITFRADPNDVNHYYADVKYDSGAASINGTLYCQDSRDDLSKGVKHDCFIKADSFRNEVSTTDSNTYYILATSASASKVSGFPWAQTAYLNDGSVATTSSPKERVDLVFAQDESQEDLGYYLTLPGTTVFGYLNNQTSNDVSFICDGKEVGVLTITKTTA